MTAKLTEIPVQEFAALCGFGDVKSEGLVAGQLRLSGPFEAVHLGLQLETQNGFVNDFYYDRFVLNGEGDYPIIRLLNSHIIRADGFSFNLEGEIDLSDYQNLKPQFKALAKRPLITDTSSQVEWTIKRKESDDQNTSTELKYLLRKETVSGAEESDMLGVEHKMKF